ncbi:hypothetical protein N7591_20195, partial [Klebsiella pneumoniae]|uniref:hypothetical protein n=1 Tax=Klebsiella pneumoniae TaxID=573 RepID=UPI00244B0418
MTDITELTQEAARESGSILIIVAARMARREFFTPLHALCEAGKRVVSTRALHDAVERAEECMVSQVPKIVDGHDRLTKKLKEAESRNAELVEALEKAHQRIDELENDEVRQRLANAEHQLYMAELAKNNLIASRKAQFRKRKAAEQRIAELESRTVKLPKPISVLHRREFTAAHCAIYAYPEAEVNAALDGAGIKW